MALQYSTYDNLVQIVRAELRRNKPGIDPSVFGSWSRGFTDGAAAAALAQGLVIRDLEKQLFPQTAEGDFLDSRWGAYENLERSPATGSLGLITIQQSDPNSAVDVVVPVGTIFRSSDGFDYSTNTIVNTFLQSRSVSSLTRSGTLATVETDSDHNLISDMNIAIAGSDQSEYNGDFIITVISANQFTYTVAGSPTSPATGSITASARFASVQVRALLTGPSTNLSANALLSLQNPTNYPGLNSSANVQFNGLTGGSNIENDDSYRARIILSRSIIEGVFTEDQIKLAAISDARITRAFVKRPTDPGSGTAADPSPGQVSVYLLNDNAPNIFPTAEVRAEIKNLIIANGALPGHVSINSLFVEAPVGVDVNFTFSQISPNTQSMQTAIKNQLQAFFDDNVSFETSVTENAYIAAIQSTQDLQTGEFIETFSLSSPTSDIAVTAGQIAVLGSVTFS